MPSLRSTTALLALLVTAWSNLTAFQCSAPPSAGGNAHAEGAHGAHHRDHRDHAASAPEPVESEEDSGLDDVGQECGVLMACGAALRGVAAAVVHAPVPPRLDDAPFASIAKPSAADLTQDPPPPRRHA